MNVVQTTDLQSVQHCVKFGVLCVNVIMSTLFVTDVAIGDTVVAPVVDIYVNVET